MKPEDVDLARYLEGMDLLLKSGVFEVLKGFAKVRPVHVGAVNYSELHIAEANRSYGYAQALEDLYRFREKYLYEAPVTKPLMDFGGIKSLLDNNRITEEEANELKRSYTSQQQ